MFQRMKGDMTSSHHSLITMHVDHLLITNVIIWMIPCNSLEYFVDPLVKRGVMKIWSNWSLFQWLWIMAQVNNPLLRVLRLREKNCLQMSSMITVSRSRLLMYYVLHASNCLFILWFSTVAMVWLYTLLKLAHLLHFHYLPGKWN